jgi:hypothetical protein
MLLHDQISSSLEYQERWRIKDYELRKSIQWNNRKKIFLYLGKDKTSTNWRIIESQIDMTRKDFSEGWWSVRPWVQTPVAQKKKLFNMIYYSYTIKVQDKERILNWWNKASNHIYAQPLTNNRYSSETLQARRERNIFQVLKENNCKQDYYTQKSYPLEIKEQ